LDGLKIERADAPERYRFPVVHLAPGSPPGFWLYRCKAFASTGGRYLDTGEPLPMADVYFYEFQGFVREGQYDIDKKGETGA
jgi:hypothetical protein